MMTANDVIHKARLTLADTKPTSYRWTDDRLLSLLNDVLQELALETRLFNDVLLLKLVDNQDVYDISDKAIKIERIEHLGIILDKKTYDEMQDAYGNDWQNKMSDSPTDIAYDLDYAGKFRLYPKFMGNHAPIFGALDSSVASADFDIVPSDTFGAVDLDFNEYIKIYHIKLPTKVTLITDILDNVISRPMLSMLANYISGYAFRDNQDPQNVALGNQSLSLYNNSKQEFNKQKFTNNVDYTRLTKYRPIT